jgi:hypothetical protein
MQLPIQPFRTAPLIAACFLGGCVAPTGGPGADPSSDVAGKADGERSESGDGPGADEGVPTYRFATATGLEDPVNDRVFVLERWSPGGELDGAVRIDRVPVVGGVLSWSNQVTHINPDNDPEDPYSCDTQRCRGTGAEEHMQGMVRDLTVEPPGYPRGLTDPRPRIERGDGVLVDSGRVYCEEEECAEEESQAVLAALNTCMTTALRCAYPSLDAGADGCWGKRDVNATATDELGALYEDCLNSDVLNDVEWNRQ